MNILPAGAKQAQQPQLRGTQGQRQPGHMGAHQAQAKGSFGTVTTPSSSYNNPMINTTSHAFMNGTTTSQPSYYNPAANNPTTPPATSTGVMSKGTYNSCTWTCNYRNIYYEKIFLNSSPYCLYCLYQFIIELLYFMIFDHKIHKILYWMKSYIYCNWFIFHRAIVTQVPLVPSHLISPGDGLLFFWRVPAKHSAI